MSEELGSYPKEYFQAEIKAFDIIKFENRADEYVSIGRVDVWACHNCRLTGDKWFMQVHDCKGIKK